MRADTQVCPYDDVLDDTTKMVRHYDHFTAFVLLILFLLDNTNLFEPDSFLMLLNSVTLNQGCAFSP